MKKTLQSILFLALLVMGWQVNAQVRYVDEVFDDVEVSDFMAGGENYTILSWLAAASSGQEGHTAKQPLVYQMYRPAGDTVTNRPLVIYLHTGNFLPFPANSACGGTIQDNSAVEICTRLAKMGYVAISADYRLGWNPLHPEELVRRYFLINAAYRGVQDLSTYVRYFKRTVEDDGNPFGIDSDKIVAWGQGTGGYIALASAYLNNYNEILTTSDPGKFVLPTPAGDLPMVIERYNGNLRATGAEEVGDIATVDAQYSAVSQLPEGDTLCIPNHIGYDSDFALAVNLGGALGDSTWINEGEVPVISVHVPWDKFAPYTTDVLNVNTQSGPQPVVEVSGSYDVQKIAHRLGVNDVFNEIPEGKDPIGEARELPFPGLLPLNTTEDEGSAPWEWATAGTPGLPDDCNLDADQAKTFIDTIMQFYAPRACVALNLGCFESSVREVNLGSDYFTVAPNPVTNGRMTLKADNDIIRSIEIYSVDGRKVDQINDVNYSEYDYYNTLTSGMYIVKLHFDGGVATKKVLFR